MRFMKTKEIHGTYGSGKTRCVIYVYGPWYVVHGGSVVNKASYMWDLVDGVDVETLDDDDCFTWSSPIEELLDLVYAVDN